MKTESVVASLVIAFCGCDAARAITSADTPPPGPLVLPTPTQTVRFRPDLVGQHPRVFITTAGAAAMRLKVTQSAMAPPWQNFLKSVDGYATRPPPAATVTDDPPRVTGDRMAQLAFASLISRDPKYLAEARTWIQAIIKYPYWATDIDLGAAHIEFGLAMAYDWLYNDLTPEERQQIEQALTLHGRYLLFHSQRWPGGYWGYAYFQNHCWINHTGAAAAAMAIYETDPMEMQRWLDFTRSRFEPVYQHLDIDGAFHEGPSYMTYGTTWMLNYVEALRSVSGEDLGDMMYLRHVGRFYLDVTLTDHRSLINYADSPPYDWDWEGLNEEPILAWLAARYQDGRPEWLRQKMYASFLKAPNRISPFTFMWLDLNVAAKSPDALPTCGVYPDLGLVVSRTSWRDDAAIVAFHCGPPGGQHVINEWPNLPTPCASMGHTHPDANAFLFWSDGQWRIANPGGYTHLKDTRNENVWTTGSGGQMGDGQMWFDVTPYYVKGARQAHLVRVASSPAADYFVGEAAPAYEAACKLIEFTRHLLFVKATAKPYVVAYDQLRSSTPQTWASHLHTLTNIAVKGNAFQSTGGLFAPDAGQELVQMPAFTPTYGTVFGPAGTVSTSLPLSVIADTDQQVQRGFELLTQQLSPSVSTWLVTVVGTDNTTIAMTSGNDSPPTLKVGSDTIAWDDTDNVALNGIAIDGNLLTSPPSNGSPSPNPGRLVNCSILTQLAPGEKMTLGTVVGGPGTSGTKSLLFRSVGPSLVPFGVTDVIPTPELTVNSLGAGMPAVIAANAGWRGDANLASAFGRVGAFPYQSANSTDSAILLSALDPGNYTVDVGDTGGAPGWILAEIYDAGSTSAAGSSPPRLVNLSVLKQVGNGMTAGFVIAGSTFRTVLLRAVGPTLTQFNVSGVLGTPQLLLFDSTGNAIRQNAGWAGNTLLSDTYSKVGAFALPSFSKDAALVATLSPGSYTVQVTGAASASGFVLVEVYDVP